MVRLNIRQQLDGAMAGFEAEKPAILHIPQPWDSKMLQPLRAPIRRNTPEVYTLLFPLAQGHKVNTTTNDSHPSGSTNNLKKGTRPLPKGCTKTTSSTPPDGEITYHLTQSPKTLAPIHSIVQHTVLNTTHHTHQLSSHRTR